MTALGAREAEDKAIAYVVDRVAEAGLREDFAAPVLLVVPSKSLRQHMMARLAASGAGAIVGVQCVTHFGLALRILQELGEGAPAGLDLFAILARRFARKEEALAETLEDLREGYNGILGAVRDLLDAGFQGAHLRAVEEALESEGPQVASTGEIERAQALARVTARTMVAFEELGVGRASTLLQAATEGVRIQPERALRASAVVLHGFADATGVTADLLQALLQAYGGLVVLDRPPDPVAAGNADASATFIERLAERLGSATQLEQAPLPAETPGAVRQPAEIDLFRALGQEAEVMEVAQRCLDLLQSGARPEGIGIVMRDPTPYVGLLRGVLGEMGLPFSGHSLTGPATPAGRRLRALGELAQSGSRTHVEKWLDGNRGGDRTVPLFDLRIALAAVGISRLDELRDLDLDPLLIDGHYPLPVRQGFFDAEEEGEGQLAVRSRRRRIPAEALRDLIAQGVALQELLDLWLPTTLPLPDHHSRLLEVASVLGWDAASDEMRELERVGESILAVPPVAVEQNEFALTFRRLAAEAGRDGFAGNGAGVQVMGVIDARGRTFEHLFILGLNRGVFPRTVREDPVLSDALRKLLERGGHGVLPDLPIKRRGYEEERYLFAELLSASPRVTLSWLEIDDGDRPMSPSPLIERLRWCHPDRPAAWREPPMVGRKPLVDLEGDQETISDRVARLPRRQQGVLAALYGRQDRLADTLPIVLASCAGCEGAVTPASLAAARLRILNEFDPLTAAAAQDCLSPYLGFIGPASGDDPRSNRDIYVTVLERMAVCPWQTMIERLLRIEAVPDPLEALPRIDGLLIGNLTHRILERIVVTGIRESQRETSAGPRDFVELDGADPIEVPWPDAATLARITLEEAVSTVHSSGIALRGFARALAAVVAPYLEVARMMDWETGTLATLAAEVRGSVDLRLRDLTPRRVAFRADRVDRLGSGLLITDYKTGASPFPQKTLSYRTKKYLREVRSGRRLQPVVYALAAPDEESFGRFSFLKPVFAGPDEARSVAAAAVDSDLRTAFEAAARTTLRAWESGYFFPRMEEPGPSQKPSSACRWCRVGEACLLQDSGMRRRLRVGMGRLQGGRGEVEEDLREGLLDHWWLPAPDDRPEASS